jgi:hypothetical protein
MLSVPVGIDSYLNPCPTVFLPGHTDNGYLLQSLGLKIGGDAMMGGARDTIVEVTSEAS